MSNTRRKATKIAKENANKMALLKGEMPLYGDLTYFDRFVGNPCSLSRCPMWLNGVMEAYGVYSRQIEMLGRHFDRYHF